MAASGWGALSGIGRPARQSVRRRETMTDDPALQPQRFAVHFMATAMISSRSA
jgi:hypothetical protein